MSLGLSKGILKLPPSLRAPHLQSLLPSDRLSLSTPSPLIHFSSPVPAPDSLPQGFTLFPSFFSITEQRILLESALQRLDAIGGIRRVDGKKVRRTKAQVAADKEEKGLQGFFMSADAYTFEEGHFDGVIRHYRESLVSSGLPDVVSASDKNSYLPKPSQLLERLHRFFVDPSKRLITHALHLAPGGRIDPHVDSLEAMGETIVGVSLGADRVLRLERDGAGIIEVLLKSGSVYVQSDEVRFKYKHSIPLMDDFQGAKIEPGHRISIMLRDEKSSDPPPPHIAVPRQLPDAHLLRATGAPPLLPPTHDISYAPLSVRDELILANHNPNLLDDIPWTAAEEAGGKHMVHGPTVQREARMSRDRTERSMIERGMKARKHGGR